MTRSPFGPLFNDHVQVLSVITALLANEGVAAVRDLGISETVYDKSHRNRIVAFANDFLDHTDPKSYRGPAAMSAEPRYR